ncbi:MAG: hypothetical protein JRH15_09330 [Deltaproteobacteria bacterium]|nr:hypothetical protein [Deltaproteobacteria bacterium]
MAFKVESRFKATWLSTTDTHGTSPGDKRHYFRRRYTYTEHIPERRSGKDRRDGGGFEIGREPFDPEP